MQLKVKFVKKSALEYIIGNEDIVKNYDIPKVNMTFLWLKT